MRIVQLELHNFRALENAKFIFQPGMNLVVGANGMGKTSILDALSVCLSRIVKRKNGLRSGAKTFTGEDVRFEQDHLHVHCQTMMMDGLMTSQAFIKGKDMTTPRTEESSLTLISNDPWNHHHTVVDQPCSDELPVGNPLAVLFSTRRSLPSNRAATKSMAAGGLHAACAGALTNREFRLPELTQWIRAQEALSAESPKAKRVVAAVEDAVTRFLPDYRNLRFGKESGSGRFLVIDRGATTLPIRLLSDGERGMLAMVLDLTRRLAQANPAMEDPAAEATAVVLIDEIELHLHPGWQRRIAGNLTETFPKCQFIATTHSPQVIGGVEHDRIQIIADGEVYSPTHSFGVDSSRVLEEIMDTPPRAAEVEALLTKVSQQIGKMRFNNAREWLVQLVDRLGEDDPEVSRITTLLDFMEGEE